MFTKICNWCKKEYSTRKRSQSFCSISCGLRRYNKGDISKIIELYNQGMNTYEISKLLGILPCTCRSIIINSGNKMRTKSAAMIKYAVNEKYFDTIDTEEKAYWIGMLITDGWVNDNRHSIGLKLKVEDIGHIQKFKSCIDSESPIKIHKNGRSACIIISSEHIKNTLSTYGIVPRKSFIVRPPNIPEELQKHFWRGCIDGDGCIRNIKNICRYQIQLNGTYAMCDGFFKFIKRCVPEIINREPIKCKNIFYMAFGGKNRCKIVTKILYENSNIYLDRKMILAKQIICGEIS